jgi:hypothetical protein
LIDRYLERERLEAVEMLKKPVEQVARQIKANPQAGIFRLRSTRSSGLV